jgi:NAD(P)-dependent dehydrogenase (short-subunit alcohol dehydrogenase family)
MRLDGRVVLVTGGSAGISAALVERLAAAGARVVVHGRDSERSAAVAERVGGAAVLGDLAVPGAEADVAGAAIAVHGQVDMLVANAGAGWSGPFVELDRAELDRLMTLDLLAPLHLVRCLLSSMIERRCGHGALVGSIARCRRRRCAGWSMALPTTGSRSGGLAGFLSRRSSGRWLPASTDACPHGSASRC